MSLKQEVPKLFNIGNSSWKIINNDLKKYNENIEAIESNRKIDVEIMGVDAKILRNDGDKDILIGKIEKCKNDIEQNTKRLFLNKLLNIIQNNYQIVVHELFL